VLCSVQGKLSLSRRQVHVERRFKAFDAGLTPGRITRNDVMFYPFEGYASKVNGSHRISV
jgi:hypothetical protein